MSSIRAWFGSLALRHPILQRDRLVGLDQLGAGQHQLTCVIFKRDLQRGAMGCLAVVSIHAEPCPEGNQDQVH